MPDAGCSLCVIQTTGRSDGHMSDRDSKNPSEYHNHDAMGLAYQVASRQASPQELLEAAIKTIESTNPVVNAVVQKLYDVAESQIRSGLPDGPFRGVPFLLKDLRASLAGVPTTQGSRFFRDNVPDRDSEIVARYKKAGLVIVGKTNTPEFGGAPTTEGSVNGATRNPWNLDYSSGGSSGGSSAAVCAGMVPAAHGSDGGGSIRIPAACTGLFGLKPSRGLNPCGPEFGEAWNGLSVEHVITRSVRDSAALLDCTVGPAVGDPYSGPHRQDYFLPEVSKNPGRLRIAVQVESMGGARPHPDCERAVMDAANLLERLGHYIEYAKPHYDSASAGKAFRLIIASNVLAAVDRHSVKVNRVPEEGELERINARLMGEARRSSSADLVSAIWEVHAVGRAMGNFFENFDVLLTPTVATPPVRLGILDITSDDVESYLTAVFRWIPYTAVANQAGIPSMSVPLSWNAEGLPIGTCFTAGYGKDAQLFRLAGQLESARPWFDRRPESIG